jgi:hypothetical protein
MRPCAYSYVYARITKTQYHRTSRSPGWRLPPISGTAQPRAQEHRCRAGAVSAVVTARFLKGILLSHALHACDHTHTPIHTPTLQTIETTGQLPTPPASPSAPSRGSSPEQRSSTERQLHRLRTHGLHPVSQDALSRRYTPPVERRTHQHTLSPSTPTPAPARAASTMVKGPHHATHSGSAPPALRTRSSSAHPDAHLPKPCNAGPRHARAPTPLAPTPRPPQRTPPATARPGPAHAATPAAACARQAPHSPAPKSMAHRCHTSVSVETSRRRGVLLPFDRVYTSSSAPQ